MPASKHLKLLLAFCLAMLWPSAAAAQMLVGVVMTGNTPYYAEMYRIFVDAVNQGLPPGEKVEFLLQKPFPDPIALSNAARKLIAAEVDVIVAYGSPAVLAVIHEKSSIPLVYGGVYDPTSAHLNGTNITGCGYKVPMASLLRYLRELKEVGALDVIYCNAEDDSVRQAHELKAMTEQQGMRLRLLNVQTRNDLGNLGDQLSGDAVFITASSTLSLWIEDILPIVKEHALPSVFILPDQTESGITVTLYQSADEQGKKTAEMVARVLRGERPDNIPPELLRNTELVFNLREAKHMGLRTPLKLIVEATTIIK